jgi:CRP-like cAMP-binding protein
MPDKNPGSAKAVRGIPAYSHAETSLATKTEAVQHFSLFSNLSSADCREIVSRAHERIFSRRETVFLEGDSIHDVILLTSGCAKVTHVGQNGGEVILRLALPGEIVGMAGLYPRDHYSSMARTLNASKALVWNSDVFEAIADRFPVIRRNILNMFCEQLREMEERYSEISTQKVAARLGNQLLRLLDQVGSPAKGAVEIHLSREELAQLIGTTLFTVSRLLSDWDQRGMLSAGYKSVLIQDVRALRQFAEGD